MVNNESGSVVVRVMPELDEEALDQVAHEVKTRIASAVRAGLIAALLALEGSI